MVTASGINSEYPIDESKLYSADFNTWAIESYNLSINDVYLCKCSWWLIGRVLLAEVFLDEPLTQDYIDNMNSVLRSRMMYAAHRLADLMVRIYGTTAAVQ